MKCICLQNLEIASNNPPSCDAYGQPLQASAQPPIQPQPTASSAVSTATVPSNASPNSRPGSAYQQPQIQPRRDSDGQQDEQAVASKAEDRNSRKVEVYKYYERDAGTAVEEHFKRALDWANSNNREGKKQRFLTVLPLGRRIVSEGKRSGKTNFVEEKLVSRLRLVAKDTHVAQRMMRRLLCSSSSSASLTPS